MPNHRSGDKRVGSTADDPTFSHLSNELQAGAGITLTPVTVGSDKKIEIAAAAGTDRLVEVSANDTTPDGLNNKLVAGTNITLTEQNDGGNETLKIDAASGGPANIADSSGVRSLEGNSLANNDAPGTDATALGDTTTATGDGSLAIGSETKTLLAASQSFVSGKKAVARKLTEQTYGAGSLWSILPGTGQHRRVLLTTEGVGATVLQIGDTGSDEIDIVDTENSHTNIVYGLFVKAAAFDVAGGHSASWNFTALVERLGGTVNLFGGPSFSPTVNDGGANSPSWSIDLSLPGVNIVRFTGNDGGTGGTIKWLAHVEIVEITSS